MTLCIQDLAFERNDTLLFSGIHCTLSPSEILQIRGRNGSGKSTLLRIVASFIQPEIGIVTWQGQNIFQRLDDYTQHICYLGHQNGIKSYLTVYENIKLSAALSHKKLFPEEIKKILQTLALEEIKDTQTIHLSAGQKRRLASTRLLLTSASLWILDEPTTALDQSGHVFFAGLLTQHIEKGGMAIVATHHELGVNGVKTLELTQREDPHA